MLTDFREKGREGTERERNMGVRERHPLAPGMGPVTFQFTGQCPSN